MKKRFIKAQEKDVAGTSFVGYILSSYDNLVILEEELNVKNREVLEWVDLTEQTFDFVCYAHVWFEKGDDKAKRAILACLGSNLTLKGKKVFVNYHSFIKTIIKSRQAVEDELERARTSKISSHIRQNPTNCEVLSLGLPR